MFDRKTSSMTNTNNVSEDQNLNLNDRPSEFNGVKFTISPKGDGEPLKSHSDNY